MPRFHLAALVLLSSAAGLAAQQTWTVAADGSAQFVDIQAAIAAASDGDLIWVEPGAYAPIVVDGKGLTILAPNNANGVLLVNTGTTPFAAPPAVTIRNLAANQRVHLSNMLVFNSEAPPADLLVQDCAGTVWLERVFCDSYGAPAMIAERCADLVIANCVLQTNLVPATPSGVAVPGPGARLVDSVVHAYDSLFHGSHGVLQGPGLPVPIVAGDGGTGIEIVGSLVTMQGGRARGSMGTVLYPGGCQLAGNGGDGVLLTNSAVAQPELRYRDVQFEAGAASGAGPFCSAPPVPGVELRVLAGQAIALAGSAHRLFGSGGFVAPATATIEIRGTPGDLVAVFASLPMPAIDVLGLSIHIGPSLIDLGFAVVDGTGAASLSVALQALPPGTPPFLGALQALVVEGAGSWVTSTPSAIVIR